MQTPTHHKPHLKGDFSKSFMYAIHQIHFLVEKHLEKKLHKEKTISFSQFLVLVCFHECPDQEDKSQAMIAKYLHTTEATVSRHIGKLEKIKLIHKKIDPANRRKSIIAMTPKGTSEFKKAHTIITKELESLFGNIRTQDRKNIIESFDTVLEKLLEKTII